MQTLVDVMVVWCAASVVLGLLLGRLFRQPAEAVDAASDPADPADLWCELQIEGWSATELGVEGRRRAIESPGIPLDARDVRPMQPTQRHLRPI